MHAIRQHRFGGPEELRWEETPDPVPAEGQVRIRIEASGVHLIDTAFRAGDPDKLPHALPELPMTPGREAAGVVDQVGPGVDPEWVGRRAVAHLGFASGGYAELAVRETEHVHVLPDGLDFAAAIALIGTGRTTGAILHSAKLTGDDVVLVTAAAGGIGNLLVQEAQQLGAFVIGLAGGEEKLKQVRIAGADAAIDYREPDFAEQVRTVLDGREATVAFDSVGGTAGRDVMELLAPGGRFLIFGWSAGKITELSGDDIVQRGLTVTSALGMHLVNGAGGLRALEELSLANGADGHWVPAVTTFPLAEAAAAHRALEGRGTIGKVVLIP